uniref:HNH endonuclease n=1 Tax=Comamonas testosteroni TaxID=285 RepID=UPI0015F79E84|nr:HNH endonuclease [Comamonas testosteroni]
MRDIPGFVGYAATEDGKILSLRDGVRELKQRLKKGYMNVTLGVLVQGKKARRCQPVHRLVCLAFHGEPHGKRNLARHLNGVSTDNWAENLAWGSSGDNAQDAIRHGTLGKGMKARRRRLTEAQVREIRVRLEAGELDRDLAVEFGVCRYYPNQLLAGKCWNHLDSGPARAA